MPIQKRCPNCKKLFDCERYSICPNCNPNAEQKAEQKISGIFRNARDNALNPTNAGDSFNPSNNPEEEEDRPLFDSRDAYRRLMPPGNMRGTISVSHKKRGFNLIAGWLVCIKGDDIGNDFRLHFDTNTVGRTDPETNCFPDVSLSDMTVSRRHFIITYDPHHDDYNLAYDGGKARIYINGKRFRNTDVELHSGDVIEVGDTTLVFVAFEGANKIWELNET